MIRGLLLALLATPAVAQSICMDHATMGRYLTERYGEVQQSIALDSVGRLVESWANPETGTWTLVVTTGNQISCILGAGESWEAVEPEPEGDPA